MSPAHWIDRSDELARAAERWRRSGRLALDTEFVYERTFRPQLGLVQIATVDEIALVDPLAIGDLSPLARLLAAPDVRIVAHAVAGDLTALEPWLAEPVRNLLDTQVAAALAGLGVGLSYAALVRTLEGVELAKHETRTDWLRRPLSPEQLRYAEEDVDHLLALERQLGERLRALERLEWAEAESAAIAAAALERLEAADAWRRIRGLERLPPRARRIARGLAAWREREAARLDLARPFLLRDPTLLALARRGELDPESVEKLPGYERRRHQRHVASWAQALAQAAEASDAAADEDPNEGERDGDEVERRIDRQLVAVVAARAQELALPAELLLPKRERRRAAAAIAAGAEPAAAIGGWRSQALAPALTGHAFRD